MTKLIFTVLLVLILLFILWNIFSIFVFFYIFHRGKEKSLDEVDLTKTHYAPYIDRLYSALKEMKNMPYEEVSVKSYDGLTLKGNYYSSNSSKTVIFVHGYRATPFNNFSVAALSFLQNGFNVLLIYQRAHGKSEGTFTTMGCREQKDVLTWTDWICSNKKPEKIFLYGTSMGATAVAYTSDKIKNQHVKGIILDCCFTNFYDSLKLNFKNKKIPFLTLRDFVAFYARLLLKINIKQCSTNNIKDCRIPMLFIHGKNDTMADINFTLRNYESCTSKKQLLLVDHAGHTASLLAGGKEIQDKVISFINDL